MSDLTFKELARVYDSLAANIQRELIIPALGEVTNEIRDKTRANIRASFGSKATSSPQPRGKKVLPKTSMEQGVRSVWKETYTVASIYGGTQCFNYYLNFLEGGTKPRKTKSGHYTGSVMAYNFFANARAAVDAEGIIERVLQKKISECLP